MFKYKEILSSSSNKDFVWRDLMLRNNQERQDKAGYYSLMGMGLKKTDILFLKHKNKFEKIGVLRKIKNDVIRKVGKSVYSSDDEDFEAVVEMYNNEYKGKPIYVDNADLDINDYSCFNPEDFKDKDGWF